MVFEVNLLAGRLLILQHKLIEALRAAPRHIVENLHAEYRERVRERWNASILRNVVPTPDFALPSEENVGDSHKKMAKSKRATDPGLEDSELLKVEDLSVFGQGQIHPIIFEEIYVKDSEAKFVKLVKANPDLLTEEAIMRFQQARPPAEVGVHLFVLCHGFQGNSCDMRMLKNNLSLAHPEAVFLASTANEDQTEGDIFEMGERLA